jgi:hypothetical protein
LQVDVDVVLVVVVVKLPQSNFVILTGR